MIEGEDRGKLDKPPEAMRSTTRTQATGKASPGAAKSHGSAIGFEFNRPTVISLLYLSSFLLGVTCIVGVVLAYVWKNEGGEDWEESHLRYLINTFWIGLIGAMISVFLMLVLVGFLLLPVVMVLLVVRCVLSIVNAQKKQPMPNPGTLLA